MPAFYRALAGPLCILAIAATAQTPVRVETVSIQAVIQPIAVSGTVTSPQTAVLSTAVSGLVANVEVDEGDQVNAGDVLLGLDA